MSDRLRNAARRVKNKVKKIITLGLQRVELKMLIAEILAGDNKMISITVGFAVDCAIITYGTQSLHLHSLPYNLSRRRGLQYMPEKKLPLRHQKDVSNDASNLTGCIIPVMVQCPAVCGPSAAEVFSCSLAYFRCLVVLHMDLNHRHLLHGLLSPRTATLDP